MQDGRAPLRLVRAAVALGAALGVVAAFAGSTLRPAGGVPLWDEAAQGFAGLEVARALRGFDVLGLLRAVNAQVVWPPLHSLLAAPFFLALGDGFETPARLSLAAFVAIVGLALATGFALSRTRGAWIGLLAASLALASSDLRAFARLGMLEAPGMALVALAAFTAARLSNARESGDGGARGPAIACGLAAAALFLFKYNYALMWFAALALDAVLRAAPAARRRAWDAALAWVRAGGWLKPMPFLVLVWAIALAAIALTGGGVVEIAGRRVSMRSPGNGAYALLVVVLAWLAVAWRRNPAAWRARWRTLAAPTRTALLWGGVPVVAWLLLPYPNRVRALVEFAGNRASGPSPFTLDGLFYYPRAFMEHHAPWGWLGALALALAFLPPFVNGPLGRARRLLWLAFVAAFVLTWLHRYHDPRFFFTTAWLAWVNAARAAVELCEAACERAPRGLAPLAWTALLVAGFALALGVRPDPRDVAARRALYRTDATVLRAADFAIERAAAETMPPVFFGYSNPLNPGLLSWRAAQTRPSLPLESLPKRAPWLEKGAADSLVDARLRAAATPGRLVLVALAGRRSPAWNRSYSDETWADRETLARLLLAADATCEADSADESGFRLAAFRVRLPR